MNRMTYALIASGLLAGLAPMTASAQITATQLAVIGAIKAAADKRNTDKTGTGTTKIAVVNLGLVFNKYERANAVKSELNQEMKKLQEEAKELTQTLTRWQAAAQKGEVAPEKREQLEVKIIDARRRLEDLNRQARTKVGKTQEANLIVLWKDIRAAVKAHAADHDIQLVLAYGEPLDKEMVDVFPNINRKMQAVDVGGTLPFFVGPEADISEAVVETLNRQYREKKADPSEEDAR